jgi:CoA:oxalate CoA-transferase
MSKEIPVEQVIKKTGPLSGIVVLDFSRVLSGPYCTMILADLGARVIKIERLHTGDDTRAYGPFIDAESAYFMCFNRGKESIALDLKSPRDREILERLLASADVLVENFRPGVMDRLGFGADRLAHTHPHIVYSSISGFGHTGPYRDHAAYDTVVQAMSGVMSLTGWPDGEPARVGPSIGDLGAGLFATIGIVSALYKRTRDGQGTRVDVSMLDCQAALVETALARYDIEGVAPQRTGDMHGSLAPFEAFAAADERFVIAAGNDTLFMLMADAMKVPEMALDPRFLTNGMRVKNRPAMRAAIEAITTLQPAAHWIALLDEAGVPCAPINSIDRVIEHPQLLARNMIVKVRGEGERTFRTSGNPIKMPAYPDMDADVAVRAPGLNQHREAIVREVMGAAQAHAPSGPGATASEDQQAEAVLAQLIS